MRSAIQKLRGSLVVAAVAMTTLAVNVSVMAQATGTNAVTALEDNVNNASGTFYPIMIGILGVMVVVGVARKFLAKAGARA